MYIGYATSLPHNAGTDQSPKPTPCAWGRQPEKVVIHNDNSLISLCDAGEDSKASLRAAIQDMLQKCPAMEHVVTLKIDELPTEGPGGNQVWHLQHDVPVLSGLGAALCFVNVQSIFTLSNWLHMVRLWLCVLARTPVASSMA